MQSNPIAYEGIRITNNYFLVDFTTLRIAKHFRLFGKLLTLTQPSLAPLRKRADSGTLTSLVIAP